MKVIPREVRKKPVTWSGEIRKLQKKLNLTSLQKKILIGTLLGDGSLIPNAYGKNYRLQIEHSARAKGYVWWKYQILKEWVLSKPRLQKRTNSWKFRTISHPEFAKFHQLFYRNKKKVIPEALDKILVSPVSLTVWFMDDGGKLADKNREYGYLLNVQQFSLKEVENIQKILWKNFSVATTRQWNNSGYRLYTGKTSRKKLDTIIRKHIHPSLEYKLLLAP